jgi:hypothetical protein
MIEKRSSVRSPVIYVHLRKTILIVVDIAAETGLK